MNLSHFLNKPYEEQVIQKLGEIHRDSIKYYLTLWYEDGTLKTSDIKNFIEKYEKSLHFKTNIKEEILIGLEEYHKCAKFCTSEKPPKRQKRNDYESSDSRK